MDLLQRFGQAIRANINSLIREAEDPEQSVEQAIEQMRQYEISVRQALAQAIATQKRTERQIAAHQSKAQSWYRQAQLALNGADENLAREALLQRRFYQDTAQNLQAQIDQQGLIINKLRQDLRVLETKIAQAKAKKDLYVARARSAVASQKIQSLTGAGIDGSMDNLFERMEAEVWELEANSELMQPQGKDELETKFAALEKSQEIEATLAEIKTQQQFGNQREHG